MNLTNAIQYSLSKRVEHMLLLSYNPASTIHSMAYDEAAQYAREDDMTELADFLDAAQDLNECMSALNEELNYGD